MRRPARTIRPLLFIVIIFVFGAAAAFPRCITPGAPAQELRRANAVLSGKVTALEYRKITDPNDSYFGSERLYAVLKVDKMWKGKRRDEFVLRTDTVNHPNGLTTFRSEDFHFTKRENYLVYAFFRDGYWFTHGCTRTKKLSEAESELKELDAAANFYRRTSPDPAALGRGKPAFRTAFLLS